MLSCTSTPLEVSVQIRPTLGSHLLKEIATVVKRALHLIMRLHKSALAGLAMA